MHTGENETNRDYKREYELRLKRRKRLVAEIDREKTIQFEAMLKRNNLTYSNWLNNKINDYINEA